MSALVDVLAVAGGVIIGAALVTLVYERLTGVRR